MQLNNRFELAKELDKKASENIKRISKEVSALKPMGTMSDLGLVMGGRPKCGEMVTIPGLGFTVVFAKARVPSKRQISEWENMATKSQGYRAQAALFSAGIIVEENRTIGNKHAMKMAQGLRSQGFTSKEEDAYIEKLETFWKENPTADSGIVEAGKIRPL